MIQENRLGVLGSQLVQFEEGVIKIGCTLRMIDDLSLDLGFLSEGGLVRYIWGKRVLDVGSGLNGLRFTNKYYVAVGLGGVGWPPRNAFFTSFTT